MEYKELELELLKIHDELDQKQIIKNDEIINSDLFIEVINKSKYLVALHDVELYQPKCINSTFKETYNFPEFCFSNHSYIFYLKLIHMSSYPALMKAISFFENEDNGFLNLFLKLSNKKNTWNTVSSTTKAIAFFNKGKPKLALSVLKEVKPNHKTNREVATLERIKKLTKREKEIIANKCMGLSDKEIGEKLFISFSTVKTHSKNIYRKLNINKITELLQIAREHRFD